MKAWAREVLIQAALDGVPQAFGTIEQERADGTVARCARGVLQAAVYGRWSEGAAGLDWPIATTYPDHRCPECGREFHATAAEWQLVNHYNDDHHFDFLTIAQKMPVEDEEDDTPVEPWPAPPMPLIFVALAEERGRRFREPKQASFDFGS